MDMDSSINANDNEQLQVEETENLYKVDLSDIDPLTRDTDGSWTTECDSGDWSAEVTQENLELVKQEPDDVCCVLCPTYLVDHNRISDSLYRLLITVQVYLASVLMPSVL